MYIKHILILFVTFSFILGAKPPFSMDSENWDLPKYIQIISEDTYCDSFQSFYTDYFDGVDRLYVIVACTSSRGTFLFRYHDWYLQASWTNRSSPYNGVQHSSSIEIYKNFLVCMEDYDGLAILDYQQPNIEYEPPFECPSQYQCYRKKTQHRMMIQLVDPSTAQKNGQFISGYQNGVIRFQEIYLNSNGRYKIRDVSDPVKPGDQVYNISQLTGTNLIIISDGSKFIFIDVSQNVLTQKSIQFSDSNSSSAAQVFIACHIRGTRLIVGIQEVQISWSRKTEIRVFEFSPPDLPNITFQLVKKQVLSTRYYNIQSVIHLTGNNLAIHSQEYFLVLDIGLVDNENINMTGQTEIRILKSFQKSDYRFSSGGIYAIPDTNYIMYNASIKGIFIDKFCHFSCLDCDQSKPLGKCNSCAANFSLGNASSPDGLSLTLQRQLIDEECKCEDSNDPCLYVDIGTQHCYHQKAFSTAPTKCCGLTSCNNDYFANQCKDRSQVCSPLTLLEEIYEEEYGAWYCKRYYYKTPQGCKQCHYTCYKCDDEPNTSCYECDSILAHRELIFNNNSTTNGQCLCMDDYFDTNTNDSQCENCHFTCKSCLNSNDIDNCQSCRNEDNRKLENTNQTSKCICKDGYYDSQSISDTICLVCPYFCQNCIDQNTCKTCKPNTNRTNDYAQNCKCLEGFYDNGNPICENCHQSCKTCDTTNQKDNCLSCDSNQFRIKKNGINFPTECLCKDKYYEDQNLICQECPIFCQNCSTFQQCTSCPLNVSTLNRIDDFLKNCPCQEQYYDDGSIECKECHISCKTCYQDNSNQCFTCQSPDLIFEFISFMNGKQMGKCNCPQGQYFEVNICKNCDLTCYNCSGSQDNQCTECDISLNRIKIGNICKCQNGFYEDNNQICQKCEKTCLNCEGEGKLNCTSCDSTLYRILENKQCICDDSYFENNNNLCQNCDQICQTCQNQDNFCLSCDTNQKRELLNNQCVCIENYYDNGSDITCQKCYHTCKRCIGPNENQCIQCLDSSYKGLYSQYLHTDGLTYIGKCNCQLKYFDFVTSLPKQCQRCHYSCKHCQIGNLSNQCTECDLQTAPTFRIMENLNRCICIEHYYDDGQDNVNCQICDIQCLNCQTFPYNCLQCQGNNRISFTENNLCICQDKFFQVNNIKDCQPCNYSCQTCNNQDTYCTSCDSNKNRELDGNICKCKIGYYDDGINENCQKCYYLCKDCINPVLALNLQNNSCTLCYTNSYNGLYNLQGINPQYGSCNCQKGNFDNGNQCEVCNYSCSHCQEGNQNNQCTECPSPQQTFHRTYNNTNKTCLCDQGYFDDGLNNQICLKCEIKCLTCINQADNCQSCQGNNRSQVIPDCPCEEGYYDNNLINCQLCHYKCKTCEQTIDVQGDQENACLSCRSEDNREYGSYTKECNCQVGYYQYLLLQECQKCDYYCKDCDIQKDICTQCNYVDVSYHRINDPLNNCPCQDKYYDDGNSEKCQPCYFMCNTCIGPNFSDCLTCNGTVLENIVDIGNGIQIGNCSCPLTGTYAHPTLGCQPCHYSCEDCTSGDNVLQCTICPDSIKSYRNPLIVVTGSEGKCTCMTGYYDSNGSQECQKCEIQCKECQTNQKFCTSCQGANRKDVIDQCMCKDSFFYPIENFLFDPLGNPDCLKCSYFCQTCQNQQDNCQTCNTDDKTRQNLPNKKCPCIQKYYDNGYSDLNSACLPCYYTCSICNGSLQNNCIQCNTNINDKRYLTSDNQCICLEGYFDIGIEQCQKCHPKCKTCKNFTECIICSESFALQNRENIPKDCECKIQYYETLDQQPICLKCYHTCKSCNFEDKFNYCQSCIHGSLYNDNIIYMQTLGQCPCEIGKYDDEGTCKACHYTCKQCLQGPLYYQCTQCYQEIQNNREINLIQGGKCPCKIGYFDDNQLECQQCHKNCKSCIRNNNPNSCISCKKGELYNYITVNNQFIGFCDCSLDGQYLNQSTFQCEDCHYSCKTCRYGPSQFQCTSCDLSSRQQGFNGDCTCKIGYFDVYETECQKCQEKCLNCEFQKDNCLVCKDPLNNFRDVNNNCECLIGYYEEDNQLKCQICHETCYQCSGKGQNQCTQCRNNFIFQNVTKQCLCQLNYYYDQYTRDCIKCHQSCNKCIGSLNNQCTKCQQGMFLENGFCVTTPSEFYDSPDGENSVLCEDQNKIYYQSSKQCVLQCPEQTFLQKNPQYSDSQGVKNIEFNQCLDCDKSCLSCFGQRPDQCIECNNDLGLELCQNKCTKPCQGNDQEQNESDCISLKLIYECRGISDCLPGEYNEKNECLKCHYTCSKCSGSRYDQCLECNVNRIFYIINTEQETGYCDCIEQFGENDTGLCDGDSFNQNSKGVISAISGLQLGLSFLIGIFNNKIC